MRFSKNQFRPEIKFDRDNAKFLAKCNMHCRLRGEGKGGREGGQKKKNPGIVFRSNKFRAQRDIYNISAVNSPSDIEIRAQSNARLLLRNEEKQFREV